MYQDLAQVRATTFERLDGILETLKRYLPERAKDISKNDVTEYISTRADSVAPRTIQKEATVLKHALKLAVEWELLNSNAAQGAKLPKTPQGRTRYLSPTELKAALEAAPDWMRAPLALAAFTGMRRGELLGLRWTDVDLPNRRVYLHETKNGSLRVLALNDLAARVLESLPQGGPGDAVFVGVDAAKLSVYTRRLFQSLKIEDASFHSLPYGCELVGDGRVRPVRRRPIARPQDTPHDAAVRASVPLLHGDSGQQIGWSVRRSDAGKRALWCCVSPRRVPAFWSTP